MKQQAPPFQTFPRGWTRETVPTTPAISPQGHSEGHWAGLGRELAFWLLYHSAFLQCLSAEDCEVLHDQGTSQHAWEIHKALHLSFTAREKGKGTFPRSHTDSIPELGTEPWSPESHSSALSTRPLFLSRACSFPQGN